MTSEANTKSIPRYFADFMKENAEQHGKLDARISASEGRLIRWMVGIVLSGMAVLSGLVFTIAYVVQTLD